MEKVVFFTHVDLDGSGCMILFQKFIKGDNTLMFIVDNDEIEGKLEELLHSEIWENFDFREYTIMFADISPQEKFCKEIAERFKKVVICDHHITADYISEYFPDQKIISYNPVRKRKECGTSILWDWIRENILKGYVDNKDVVSLFVNLVRLYDTWEWKESKKFGQEALDLNTVHSLLGQRNFIRVMKDRLFEDEEIFKEEDILYIEAINLKEKKRFTDASANDDNRCITINNLMCYVKIIGPEGVSKYADWFLSAHKEYDVYIGINPKDGTVSFRTQRDDVNVAAMFAKPLGGGGHAKAAGATLKEEFTSLYNKYLVDSFDKIESLLNA